MLPALETLGLRSLRYDTSSSHLTFQAISPPRDIGEGKPSLY
jgi:hypothetical protein